MQAKVLFPTRKRTRKRVKIDGGDSVSRSQEGTAIGKGTI